MHRIRQSKGNSLTQHVVWRSPNSNAYADSGTSGDLRELVKGSDGLDCGEPANANVGTSGDLRELVKRSGGLDRGESGKTRYVNRSRRYWRRHLVSFVLFWFVPPGISREMLWKISGI